MRSLTTKELIILQYVAHGLTAKEIAKKINIHYRTVQTRFMSIRYKLKAKNMTHAIYIARKELESHCNECLEIEKIPAN